MPKNALQKFHRGTCLPRRQHVRKFPRRRSLFGNHQCAHIFAPNLFSLRSVRRELANLRSQPHQVAADKFREIFRRAALQFHVLVTRECFRQRRSRREPRFGIVAESDFDNQRAIEQQLAQLHPLIERFCLQHERGEWRGVFEIRSDRIDSRFAILLSELFDPFEIFDEDDLLLREHRQHLCLLQRLLCFAAIRRETRHAPHARAFRDELLNQVRATRIAQIRLITKQQNCWNQLSALQLRQEFLLRHPRHQKTPENGN